MWSLRPAISRVKGRLFGKKSLQDYAVRTEEIAPGGTLPMRPTVNLDGEFDRIINFIGPVEDPIWERRMQTGGDVSHPATTSYLLKDALVANGMIFVRGAFEYMPDGKGEPLIINSPAARIDKAQLCTDFSIRLYFGHWIIDGLCLELLAEQRGLIALPLWRPEWGHEAGYREMARLHRPPTRVSRVKELWVVDDKGSNAGRTARVRELRSRVRSPGDGPRRIFLDRGTTGAARQLGNRDEVAAALRARGFIEVFPEAETAQSLSHKLSNAEICVGIEGSALAHATALMPEESKLLILQPPKRFTLLMKNYADMANIIVGYVVGEPMDDSDNQAFTIPVDRLQATIDLLEQAS